MALIIKCGFDKITHPLRKSVMQKGKRLFDSGHVLGVEEEQILIPDENCNPNFPRDQQQQPCEQLNTIRAYVLPQTSVSKSPYAVYLKVNLNREVVETLCKCKAGKGQCKHIAATIVALNDEQTVTCTSKPQSWGAPSLSIQERYKKGRKFEDMFPPKITCPQVKASPPIFENIVCGLGSLSSMLLAEKVDHDFHVCSDLVYEIVSKVHDKCLEDDFRIVTDAIVERQRMDVIYSGYNIYSSDRTIVLKKFKPYISNCAAEFYNRCVNLSPDEATEICYQTMSQSSSQIWQEERKIRIPSSVAHRVKTRKGDFEKLSHQLLHSKPFKHAATEYGSKTEDKARTEYTKQFGEKVIQLGLTVLYRQPFMCCSPDGIIINGSNLSLLEIKCPYNRKDSILVDLENNISYVPYLVFQNDHLALKKTHIYYTQIQCSLYVTKADLCYLFVYSSRQTVRLVINRDEDFWSEYIPKLEWFYFCHHLVNMTNSM